MGKRPAWVALAFLAGAFFGIVPSIDLALFGAAFALACALWAPVRPVAVALALGLLRGALHERPAVAASFAGEFDGVVLGLEDRRAVVRRGDGALILAHVEGAHRGDAGRFDGKLWVPSPALNPGGRDEREALALRGIALAGSAELFQLERRGPWQWRFLDDVRARFATRAAEVCSNADRAALVAALGVGDRTLLSPETEDELAASGLVHLLASSGLHLAVVAFLAREGARRAWLRSPWAPRARASFVGALAAVPLVIAEVFLLGAPWPAVRAGVAAVLALTAAALARRSDGLTLLGLGTCACAALDPASTHDLALQLSATGICGLLVLARPIREWFPLRPTRLEPVLRLACATAAATLCTAPLIAATFHRVSLVSIAANALALWPGLAAIPVATALVALDWLPLWFVADQLAGLTLWASRLFSSAPFATERVPAPGVVACALWMIGLFFVWKQRVRLAAPAFLLACVLLVRPHPRALRLTFLAAGQGDSTLVQFADGHTMLIDAGGDLRGFGTRNDPGARVVLPALAELGVTSLDVVVLTHPHPDHAGGLPAVLDHVPVGELWMNPGDDGISRVVRAHAEARGIPVREPSPRTYGSTRIEVLSRHDPRRTPNDDSIVLRLVDGEARALLAGDIEALTELELAQRDISAQLLKAPHHGSRTSSTDAFLRAVHPRDVVYEVGPHNSFNFPNADVVARTEALGARTFRTDAGAVIAERAPDGFRVSRW